MAYDRFIRWDQERPVDGQLQAILEDYLGEAGKVHSVVASGMIATLKGKPSEALRRITKKSPSVHSERWFEVFVTPEYADVITRTADEYTNAVAQGYADIIARLFNANTG